MNGTEWTEPGQGATVADLLAAIEPMEHTPGGYQSKKWARAYNAMAALPFKAVTNLRLTGQPLTAADVQRIAGAK